MCFSMQTLCILIVIEIILKSIFAKGKQIWNHRHFAKQIFCGYFDRIRMQQIANRFQRSRDFRVTLPQ